MQWQVWRRAGRGGEAWRQLGGGRAGRQPGGGRAGRQLGRGVGWQVWGQLRGWARMAVAAGEEEGAPAAPR